jgi:hypothetical protein
VKFSKSITRKRRARAGLETPPATAGLMASAVGGPARSRQSIKPQASQIG